MKQRNIAISLSTLGALALVTLFTIGGDAAERSNQIVAPDMKPRAVPQLKQKIEIQPFKRGAMKPRPVPQLEQKIEIQPFKRGAMKPRPVPQLEQKVDEAMGVVPSPSPGASKGIEGQPFKRGLLKDSLSLFSRKGQRLEARYTNKAYALYDLSRGKNVPAADGSYRLQGGGLIKVEKGYVIWADDLAIQRSAVAGVLMVMP